MSMTGWNEKIHEINSMQGSKRDENRILRMKMFFIIVVWTFQSSSGCSTSLKKLNNGIFPFFPPNFFPHCLFRVCGECETKLNLIRVCACGFFKFSICIAFFMCSYLSLPRLLHSLSSVMIFLKNCPLSIPSPPPLVLLIVFIN